MVAQGDCLMMTVVGSIHTGWYIACLGQLRVHAFTGPIDLGMNKIKMNRATLR